MVKWALNSQSFSVKIIIEVKYEVLKTNFFPDFH